MTSGKASIDIEMSLRQEDERTRPDGLLAQREVRAKVFHALRSQTRADDTALRAFIDSYEAGHSREGEVVTRLGLTDQTFRATLARFHRLKGQLPEELRRSAMEVMIQDGGPQAATLARRAGRPVGLVANGTSREPVNDSADSLDAMDATDGDVPIDESQDAA